MAKILLVDDDQDLCIIVSDKLALENYEVSLAHSGSDAEKSLKDKKFDLFILDWDLPDTSGVQICRNLRSAGNTTPVLMLTGRGGLEAKEEGFDSGADDYLTKPFEMKELSMRVRALLRRAITSSAEESKQQSDKAGWELKAGSIIDSKYRLEEFIGQGGMALIFRATHLGMQKPVVVKLIQAHLLEEEVMLKRFQQECLIMAKLNHGNVVAVFDTGVVNGTQPYLVMEYVKGESLADRIQRDAPLPVATALDILIQVCRGLEAAHGANIIHRDLKPSNILLQQRGNDPNWVKIVDFGLALLSDSGARLTQADVLMGSAGYISPEQLRGIPLDDRVDIYALGVILFEMLTRDLPFKASNTEAFLIKQLLEQPEQLSQQRTDIMPGSPLELIAAKALEKDPDKRYQSVKAMRLELEHLLQKELPDQ